MIGGMLAEVLFPGSCPGCGSEGADALCGGCEAELPRWAVPLPVVPECVESAWVLGPYSGPLGHMVRRAKYRPDERSARFLAGLARRRLGRVWSDIDVVVGVPQAAGTSRRRLFSPVDLLAREVAREVGATWSRPLRRVGGRSLAGLPGRRRREEVRGQFVLRGGRLPAKPHLLIDDVVTSGATSSEVAKLLLQGGASEVHLIAVASPDIN